MVSIGKPSSSTPGSGKKTSTKELVTVFGGTMVGVAVLLLGVVGIIVSLPEPKSTVNLGPHKMLTPEQAAKAAHERLEKAKKEALQKNKYHTKFAKQMPKMISSDQASKDARARLARAGAEYVEFRDMYSNCEDERSFLIELLTDSQLYEFMEYLERNEDEDGEYYRAESSSEWSCSCEEGEDCEDTCSVCLQCGTRTITAGTPFADEYYWPNREKRVKSAKGKYNWYARKGCDYCGEWLPEEAGYTATNGVFIPRIEMKPFVRDAESLGKDSCCCGATAEDPCVCMIEGVMDCSAVEPKCPCYEVRYVPDELIPIGTKVRSYDFWPHDKTCYKEGVIVDHAPSPSCSPGCMHYHIRTTKVVRRGKSRPVEEGEIFMTHPYADPWDQEYPGQLAQHIKSVSTAFPSTASQ